MNVLCRNNGIMGRRPKWNKENILESISNYITEHNRLPYAKEIDTTHGLPKRLTIKRVFGCSYDEFCKVNFFPFYGQNSSRIYKNYSISDLIIDFKKQYIEMGYPSMTYYDSHRRKGSPQCRHICKLLGITYNEFLSLCGFELKGESKFSKKRPQKRIISTSMTTGDYNVGNERTKAIMDDIEKILKKY